ncbi:hypothetical protein FHEFKHOI_00576 [Candidatus Methanoperedenaceae archaeon GB50]|nr:hypothetical protein AIOGIFDO_00575 [Candidatus Methanoperedenaceae archaeon GB37]CAD7769318.1 hypothetical protein FHEFKHOI_00576 [Candidatus Methanoperedenaceae archaeon GB50]
MEWSTVCTAHNSKTIWNKREYKTDLLRKIDGLRKKIANSSIPNQFMVISPYLTSIQVNSLKLDKRNKGTASEE